MHRDVSLLAEGTGGRRGSRRVTGVGRQGSGRREGRVLIASVEVDDIAHLLAVGVDHPVMAIEGRRVPEKRVREGEERVVPEETPEIGFGRYTGGSTHESYKLRGRAAERGCEERRECV
jgi:hypothetical protein